MQKKRDVERKNEMETNVKDLNHYLNKGINHTF